MKDCNRGRISSDTHAYRTFSEENAALQSAGQASAKERAQSGSGTAPVECVYVECVELTENE